MTDNKEQIARPNFVKNVHLEYLDELRDSGDTNMFGARPYLMRKFRKLSEQEASSVLAYWMKTFSQRHSQKQD